MDTYAIGVWGLPAGETERWTETLLAESCRNDADVARVVAAASADGWHSFRVARIDLSRRPDFSRTLA